MAARSLHDNVFLVSEDERTLHCASTHLGSVVGVVACAGGIEMARKASCWVGGATGGRNGGAERNA